MKIRVLPTNKEYNITHFAETYNTKDDALSVDMLIETSEGITELKEAFSNSDSFELLRNENAYPYAAFVLSNITRSYTDTGEVRTSVRYIETAIG